MPTQVGIVAYPKIGPWLVRRQMTLTLDNEAIPSCQLFDILKLSKGGAHHDSNFPSSCPLCWSKEESMEHIMF